jgi:hypothetical protein
MNLPSFLAQGRFSPPSAGRQRSFVFSAAAELAAFVLSNAAQTSSPSQYCRFAPLGFPKILKPLWLKSTFARNNARFIQDGNEQWRKFVKKPIREGRINIKCQKCGKEFNLSFRKDLLDVISDWNFWFFWQHKYYCNECRAVQRNSSISRNFRSLLILIIALVLIFVLLFLIKK